MSYFAWLLYFWLLLLLQLCQSNTSFQDDTGKVHLKLCKFKTLCLPNHIGPEFQHTRVDKFGIYEIISGVKWKSRAFFGRIKFLLLQSNTTHLTQLDLSFVRLWRKKHPTLLKNPEKFHKPHPPSYYNLRHATRNFWGQGTFCGLKALW